MLKLRSLGLAVPDGLILTTPFFEPWFQELQTTTPWALLDRRDWPRFAREILPIAENLAFTQHQEEALHEVDQQLRRLTGHSFAVRSSSPDEDLSHASFAGGYASVIGVPRENLRSALRKCFQSVFDERVLVYKHEHGFEVTAPRLAIVIQEALDSTIAGVAFSINPMTNDYDEVLITANWGQGETVVSGGVTPDQYVWHKYRGDCVEKTLGSKESSSWLSPAQGLELRDNDSRRTDWTLTHDAARAITQHLCQIEDAMGQPVDVEWAYANETLYFLQARPITIYVPLTERMQTAPGERRRLYFDAGLMEGTTMNAPLTHMSVAQVQDLTIPFGEQMAGVSALYSTDIREGLLVLDGCRTYINLSNAFWVSKPKALATKYENMDVIAARIFRELDSTAYRSAKCPASLRGLRFKSLWHMRKFVWASLQASVTPERFHQRSLAHCAAFEARLEATGTPIALQRDYLDCLREFSLVFLGCTLPGIVAFWGSGRFLARALFWGSPRDIQRFAEKLDQGLPNELVVEMGMAIYQLSVALRPDDYADIEELADRIQARQMPSAFLQDWDAFIQRFGARGPEEMELSNPRYADDPTLLLRQMAAIARNRHDDPELRGPTLLEIHKKHLREREEAFSILIDYLEERWWRRWKIGFLRSSFRLITLFGSGRDTPKHHLVLLGYQIRRNALRIGEDLAKAGHLDDPNDVFGLSVEELRQIDIDSDTLPPESLRPRIRKRFQFYHRLQRHVRNFPHLIDSRGRIPKPSQAPKREGPEGQLHGMPISSGIHRGPIRNLYRPDASAIQPGDVLVTYVTDPGWTPLFIHAGAILLEVGGPLQHGALVAREFGKPCVVGIDEITSTFPDDQWVEVNGDAGTVCPILEG